MHAIDSADQIPPHRYSGARSMVLLHEHYLRSFLRTWRRAQAAQLTLPKTDDTDYESLEKLLAHVCGAAGGYMKWMCEVLELADPGIHPAPGADAIADEAEQYVDHVLERWRSPLAEVDEERFHRPEHPSRWKVRYCVDAMLEHAVMHPLRHEFQLAILLKEAQK